MFVVLRYRAEILTSLLDAWKASILVFGLAIAAMVLATPVLIGTPSLAYIDWWNGELVNYSMFAHYFLGIAQSPNHLGFFEGETAKRYGAEMFLAIVSMLTGKAPLMLVEVLSAFHKMAAIVAFAVSFEMIRKEHGIRPLVAAIVNVGFAFSSILSLNHVMAFLAAQAVTASCILLTLGLLSQGVKRRGVQIFLAIQLLFILVTYAEALPFLLGAAAVISVEAYFTKREEIAFATVCVFAAGLLINPILLAARVDYMYRLRLAIAGFNVLGSPKDGLLGYLATTLGLQYQYVDVPPLQTTLLAVGTVLSLLVILCAFVVAAFELKTLLLLGVPAILFLAHLSSPEQPPTSAFYKSYKAIAALYFYISLAIGFLVERLLRPSPRSWPFSVPRQLLLAGVCLLIGGNIIVSIRAAAWIKTVPPIYHEADFRRALAPRGTTDDPLLVLSHDMPSAIWELMASYLHSTTRLLGRQAGGIRLP